MKLIIGLGNPGKKYEQTRHNVGFIVLDKLAQMLGADEFKFNKKFKAEVSEVNAGTEKIILVKPQTFMNNSGQAVRAILDFYKLLPKTLGIFSKKQADLSAILTVIHDDVDLELEKFKIQANRSSAGHNGIKSIINHLKTQNFTRGRIGINSQVKHNMPTEKFVLGKFSSSEINKIKKIIPDIIKNI